MLKQNLQKLRLELDVLKFCLAYSLLTLALYHQPLFSFVLTNIDHHSFNGIMILFESVVAQFAAVFVFFILLSFIPALIKPTAILFLLTNSLALYFVREYNVILDKTMMGNVFNTDFKEASDLYSSKILLYIFLFGILPAILVSRIKIKNISGLSKISSFIVAVLLVGTLAYLNSKTWLWYDKHAKRLGGLSMPFSYVINSVRYYKSNAALNQIKEKIPDASFIDKEKTIVVLVIGESARKNNFSLYGYQRQTNPYLSKDNVAVMPNTKSCTTYTSASIKCMLSHQGSNSSRTSYELLPEYLERSGVNVLWRSNNWGAPKLDIKREQKANDIFKTCKEKCETLGHDEILLYGLESELKNHSRENMFVVLHQVGSHGPLYYEKYPQNFEIFKPTCKSVQLQNCTHEELINAYDNTIAYTDYFLHKLILLLSSLKKTSSVMIYISDHGESLGEYNFYLHGTPYSIAPDFQKQIPFLIWMSDEFKRRHHLTNKDLTQFAKDYSQDNIFHSVMGAFGMRSGIYDKKLDVFQ